MNTAATIIRQPIPRMLDSGCNIIAIHPEDVYTTLPGHRPLKASTANNGIMESTEEGRLDFNHELSNIPERMLEGHVLPTLAKHTIVGLGVLCDHGCVVVLTREKAYIMHENRLILSGSRKPGHLWFLNPQDTKKAPTVSELITRGGEESIPPPSYLDRVEEPIAGAEVNSITSVYQSKRLKDAMQFHHASFNNCSKRTLLKAAELGILPLWPLLTRKNISKHITETRATHMGHLQRVRSNLRSTRKEIPLYLQDMETEGMDIVQEQKSGEVYILMLDVARMNGTVFTDLTGAFPVTSARGNKYLIIAYSFDALHAF